MIDVEKIKSRSSYKKFKEISKFFDSNPSKEDILKKVHSIIDGYSGFGSQKNSDAAFESIELIISEGI